MICCGYERRKKKEYGLLVLRSLAQNHVDTLRTRLHDVCLVLVKEVAPPSMGLLTSALSFSLFTA